MPQSGHPVSPLLFIGRPRHLEAHPEIDPLEAVYWIHHGVAIFVPHEDIAKEILKILGATDEHAELAVHYAD